MKKKDAQLKDEIKKHIANQEKISEDILMCQEQIKEIKSSAETEMFYLVIWALRG